MDVVIAISIKRAAGIVLPVLFGWLFFHERDIISHKQQYPFRDVCGRCDALLRCHYHTLDPPILLILLALPSQRIPLRG